MQNRIWLSGSLKEAERAARPVTRSLLAAMEHEHMNRWITLLAGMKHSQRADGADIRHIEDLVLAQSAFQLCAMAASIAHVHGQAFDPAVLSAFVEQIAREFAPDFAAIEAEEDSKTATKN